MAEPDGQGGIRQWISLAIRKSSVDQVANDAKRVAKNIADSIREGFTLVKIPALEELEKNAVKSIKKAFPKDLEAQRLAIQRAQIAQQMANTTFTASGKILNALGVNVYKTSFAYQALTANLKNVGSSLPPVVGNLRSFVNTIGGQGLVALKSFAGQLGIAFSIYRLVTFAKSAVTTAAESQAAWARLSSTLSDFGIPLSKVQTNIEAVVASQTRLGIKQQDSVEILATLIQISGDYTKSLKAMTVVTDLMIARHFTQEQAARAVGRAMIGDNMLLSRQGIILDKNRDAIEQLTERMRGELAARAVTLAGKIAIVSSGFNDLKIAIGNALTSSRPGGFADQLVESLKEATTWVKANQQDFQSFMDLLMGFGKIVLFFFNGFATGLKLVEAAIGSTDAQMRIFGANLNRMETLLEVQMLKLAGQVVKAWDWVFKTHHDGIEKMIKEGERAADEYRKQGDQIREDRAAALKSIFAPDEAPSGPKAPDFALGTAGKIQSKVQEKYHRDTRQLGNIALHGREDDAAHAMELLNKRLADQEKLASELAATDELRARNAGAILDAESNIADIKKIQVAYDKKMDDSAAQRRKDAHTMQEIERLGRVARQADDPAVQAQALARLATIQQNLTAEQAKQVKYSERYFILQNMIDQVDNQREQRAQLQDKDFKDRIDKLHDQLVLHVEEAQAAGDLEAIMADLNKQYAEAVTVQDKLRLATRRRMVEQAMMTDNQVRQARITQLELDLQDPAKRRNAEVQLLAISKQINAEMFKRKTLNVDITDLTQIQRGIQEALAAIEHTSAADLSKMLSDAKKLGKGWDDRKTAAELYKKIIEDINKQLDGHIALTDIEKQHLEVLLKTAEDGLNSVNMVTGNMIDEWKQLWAEVGDSFIDNVSNKIADSWTRAAELMLGDLKDIKKGATTAFQGMGKAFAAEIKSIATLRVKQHIAEAVSEGAEAIKALANHNWHAAAMHAKGVGHQLLAAAKWAALAGAAGNIGGQGVSGAGAASGNTGRVADNNRNQGPIIYLKIDGIDPNNPRHQQLAGATIEKWQETANGAQIALR